VTDVTDIVVDAATGEVSVDVLEVVPTTPKAMRPQRTPPTRKRCADARRNERARAAGVSEKTYALMDRGVYVFIVDPTPPRSTCVTPWSSLQRARHQGQHLTARQGHPEPSYERAGQRPNQKRAMSPRAGDTIDLFES